MSVVSELRRAAGSGPKRPAARTPLRRGDGRAAAVFLLPWFAGLFLVTIGPMIASGYLAFTDYSLLAPPEWVGLDNFARLAEDSRLHNALRVTFTYVFTGVPLQLMLALALAMILDRGMRGLAFYRSVFYLPSLLGGSVAIAILWRQIFGVEGLVNGFLALVNHPGRGWVSDPDTALWTIVLLHVWTFGSPMIIFLAGLRQIPEMYYEAASIDGAGKVRQFLHITLPLLTPIVFFNLVLQVIGAFQSFTQAFVVSGGTGGPADSTMFITLYLYQKGFTDFDMGYASAIAWLLVLIIGALTAINFLASKFWVFYDD
ncbi:carbohydrate ABC transporter permease [Cellulomonas sp. SLBN-39]|uniref:carbohydrate ABC transporter permease n=1 Tax=Cellulomonas sp. SLBN-39 TaxID=2768446 RepID=UPI00114F5179|nr:sugar ABC transporter permease [Cellulomonas sp. SLBN-39]TQL02896.1 carbohydrate ABC transporter membrane protein 1 (CUT1 family) [Cellulomonas sp. SLBN-39]